LESELERKSVKSLKLQACVAPAQKKRKDVLTQSTAHSPAQLMLKVFNLLQDQRARFTPFEIILTDLSCSHVLLVLNV
jgi:hypothetical protein